MTYTIPGALRPKAARVGMTTTGICCIIKLNCIRMMTCTSINQFVIITTDENFCE